MKLGRRGVVGSSAALMAFGGIRPAASATTGRLRDTASPGTSQAEINVDLTAATDIVVRPEIFGFATAAMLDDACRVCANEQFQRQFARLEPTLLRCNSVAGGGHSPDESYWLCSIFPNSEPANPQWRWIDPLLDNLPRFMPNGRLVLDIGYHRNKAISPARLASMAQQLARHCIAKGVECFYWEVWNEANQPPGNITVETYNAWFNAVADALHAVNPAYKVGGPVSSWSLAYGPEWARACGERAGFIDFHGYPYGDRSATDHQLFTTRHAAQDMTAARSAVHGTPAATLPLAYLEWSSMFNAPGDPRMRRIQGAVFAATYLASAIRANQGLEMAGIWEVFRDGNYGVIADTTFRIYPAGWYLGYAGRNMAGTVVKSNMSPSGNVDVLATVDGGKFAVQIINHDGSIRQVRGLRIMVPHSVGPEISRWEISPRHMDPVRSTVSYAALTQGSGISLPPLSVVILTGAFS